MSENYQEVIRATYRYYYEDGFVEMAVGALFAGFGLLIFGISVMSSGPLFALSLAAGLPLLVIGGARLVERSVAIGKDRITHQRTGAVKYRKNQRSPVQRRALLFGLLIILLITAFVPAAEENMSLAEGLLLAVVLGSIGHAYGIIRFYATAALSVVIGIAAALLTATDMAGSAFTFGVMGAVLVISGAVAFKGYMGRSSQSRGVEYE